MKRCRGFSLIELMISLVLGLVISGAVLNTFVYNNQARLFQQEALAIQEQGRVSLDMMARFVRMAGFQESDLTSGALSDGLSSDSTDSMLKISYRVGPSMSTDLHDCLGRAYTSAANDGDTIRNEFKLNGGDLVCEAWYENTPVTTKVSSSTAKLAVNIEQLQIRYGEDLTGDQVPNRYVGKATVGASNMDNVVAVEICLVLASENAVLDQASSIQDCASNATTSDRKLRRRMRTTVALRNRLGS